MKIPESGELFCWTRLSFLPIYMQADTLEFERKEYSPGIPGLEAWYIWGQLDLLKLPDFLNFRSALRAALRSHPIHGHSLLCFSRRPKVSKLPQQPRHICSHHPSVREVMAKTVWLR